MKKETRQGIREIVFCNYFIIDVCKNVYDIPIDISTQAGLSPRKKITFMPPGPNYYRLLVKNGTILEIIIREKIFKQFNMATALLVQLLGYFREGKLLQRAADEILLDFEGIVIKREDWVPCADHEEFARENLSKTLPTRIDITFFENLHGGRISHSQNPPVWLPSEERILQPKDTPRTQDQLIYLYWLREDIFSELVRNEITQINKTTDQKETQ